MSANEITPQPIPLDVNLRDTTETPPGANEIHVVERDWGYELSFDYKGEIRRLTRTTQPDAATARQIVGDAKVFIDTPTDRRAELEDELAFHEGEVARIQQELVEIN